MKNNMPDEIWVWLSQVSNKSSTETATIIKSWSDENECDQTEFSSVKYIRADINAQLQEQCDSQLQTIDALKQKLYGLNDTRTKWGGIPNKDSEFIFNVIEILGG